jgi:hypothetical protein
MKDKKIVSHVWLGREEPHPQRAGANALFLQIHKTRRGQQSNTMERTGNDYVLADDKCPSNGYDVCRCSGSRAANQELSSIMFVWPKVFKTYRRAASSSQRA